MEKVTNLIQVFEHARSAYAQRRLFGTRRQGEYRWITYQAFAEQVDLARGGLAEMGVARGDRVAIISDNRVEWAAAAYATYGLVAQFVPMYEDQATQEWRYILNDSQARVVIAADARIYDQLQSMLDDIDSLERVINLDGAPDDEDSWAALLEAGRAHPTPSTQPDSTDIAGLIYTSGTTGNPKGVLLSHGNFASNIEGVRGLFDIREDDSSLSFLPWAHSFGQTCELHCMLAEGAALGLAESVQSILANLDEVRPTLLFAVPQVFNRIYSVLQQRMARQGGVKKTLFDTALANAQRRRRLAANGQSSWWVEQKHQFFDKTVFSKVRDRFGGRLRYAFSGGAALSTEVATFIDDLGITIYEGYGLSETSPIATANSPGHRKIGSVGRPLPGVTIKIEPVPHIEERGIGEIIIYGPNVMQGYHNQPEATSRVFTSDGGFRSGDLGRQDGDGYLYITGRVKEQYKLENGKYVVPAPLEELLQLAPAIHQIMIHGANRPYNVALIAPNFDFLAQWAAQQGKPTAPEAMLKDSAVKKLITEQLREYGKGFRGYEHPRKFRLLTEEFSTDNGMLTPKMSLKRRNIMKAHGELIDDMYRD